MVMVVGVSGSWLSDTYPPEPVPPAGGLGLGFFVGFISSFRSATTVFVFFFLNFSENYFLISPSRVNLRVIAETFLICVSNEPVSVFHYSPRMHVGSESNLALTLC